ncbi:MAG: lamin tail domain-containing protein [Chloroflexi bacterium]|nr:lamin tail domain-containing protein [Chloroflexota bacterium]
MSRFPWRRDRPRFITLFILVLACIVALNGSYTPAVQAVSPNIVISQVYGGGGNTGAPLRNDFIELFNRGTTTVSLSGWSVQYASATGTGNFGATSTQITELPALSLAPGQYLLIQEASQAAVGAPLPTPDVTDATPIAMSATGGKVALVSSAVSLGCNGGSTPCSPAQLALIVDLVGYDGANFFEGAPTPALSNTTAALRAGNGCTDTDNNATDFAVGAPTPRNTASPLNPCGGNAPVLATCGPAMSVPQGTSATRTVTASDADGIVINFLINSVTPSPAPGTINLTGLVPAGAIGGTATAVVNIGNTIPLGSYAVQVTATNNNATPQTGTCSLNVTIIPPLSAIHDIQGASHLSPKNNQLVTTTGIVIAKRSNGFYIQDPNPDGNPATSEGLFVFTNSAPTVNSGDAVQVSGTVKEFRPGGASATNLTTTEIDNPGRTVTVLSSGNPLPAPTIIGTGGRVPPAMVIDDDATGDVETSGSFDVNTDGIDFYESLEGMRVQINNAVATGPRNSFGEIPVLGDNGASASVRTARGGIVIRANDFNPERVFIDNEILNTPNANVNDRFAVIVGVMDYSFGNFKLQITQALTTIAGGLAPESAATAPAHQLSVATFNVENLDPSDPPSKFSALANIVVNNLKSPDLIAVEEIQDNNGATNDAVVDATTTFNQLIAAISSAGGPAYQFRQINPVDDQDGGEPGGNIRVGFMFRTDRGLAFVDRPGGTATNSTAITGTLSTTQLTFSPGRIDPANAAFNTSRKPLAGEFMFKGDKVFVIANHWNSKGGDQPLFGHFQPPILSSETQRVQQATVVRNFVAAILAANVNANVIVLGDLNDFEFSNPLATIKSAPLNALIETLPQNERYTYVFDGNSQTLDHILVSNAIYGRPRVLDVVHVNAEFVARASDHDPQVAFMCVDATPPALEIKLTPNTLWPPLHQYVTVKANVKATDNATASPTITFVSVTANEPDNGLGDGDAPNDIVIGNSFEFQLRAERSGTGAGRTYTITYRATDACGNVTTKFATVFVPHSLGN